MAKWVNPHLLIVIDVGWFGIRCGAAYYDINRDVIRPAFLDIIVWNKWRCTFEAGRISNIWNRYG